MRKIFINENLIKQKRETNSDYFLKMKRTRNKEKVTMMKHSKPKTGGMEQLSTHLFISSKHNQREMISKYLHNLHESLFILEKSFCEAKQTWSKNPTL